MTAEQRRLRRIVARTASHVLMQNWQRTASERRGAIDDYYDHPTAEAKTAMENLDYAYQAAEQLVNEAFSMIAELDGMEVTE